MTVIVTVSCAPAVSPTTAPTATTAPTLPAVPTVTPTPAPTATPTPAPTPTDQSNCYDSALYVADVTIPDNTKLDASAPFTKTWRMQNTGTCTWNERYSIVYIGGERMGSPAAVPLAETKPGATLDISVPLTAPTQNGFYTGLYALHDPLGRPIQIGGLTSFWLKIRVGDVVAVTPGVAGGNSNGAGSTPAAGNGGGGCQYSENSAYASELMGLINAARENAKLKPLSFNGQLAAAAQAHSQDMACNNFLGHTGSNGSWIGDRLAAAGYATYNYTEVIAIGTPQDAMAQWASDATHWNAILQPDLKEIGVGYVYAANSNFGGYFTVDMASP